jgi:hypothetical protein
VICVTAGIGVGHVACRLARRHGVRGGGRGVDARRLPNVPKETNNKLKKAKNNFFVLSGFSFSPTGSVCAWRVLHVMRASATMRAPKCRRVHQDSSLLLFLFLFFLLDLSIAIADCRDLDHRL